MSAERLLEECRLQLKYLNEKFGETGTTNALLSKLEANQPKEQQKQALIEMMKGDEELGVYENELREGKITIHIEPTKTGYSAHYELGDAVIATTGVDIPEIFGNLKEATELAQAEARRVIEKFDTETNQVNNNAQPTN